MSHHLNCTFTSNTKENMAKLWNQSFPKQINFCRYSKSSERRNRATLCVSTRQSNHISETIFPKTGTSEYKLKNCAFFAEMERICIFVNISVLMNIEHKFCSIKTIDYNDIYILEMCESLLQVINGVPPIVILKSSPTHLCDVFRFRFLIVFKFQICHAL